MAGGGQLREMTAQVNLLLGLVVGPNAAVLLSSVGSVHAGSTFPAIQGASLTTLSSQPNSLVTGGFPAEDEQHSQPVSPQGLHYLHSAYRVGKDGQVGFYGPVRGIQGRAAGFHSCLVIRYCTCWGDGILATWGKPVYKGGIAILPPLL